MDKPIDETGEKGLVVVKCAGCGKEFEVELANPAIAGKRFFCEECDG